jgi:hypothetical protein
MLRLRALPIAVLAVTLVAAAPASATLKIGISEQNSNVFGNTYFTALKMHSGRLVVPWNVAFRHDYWRKVVNAWLAGAAADGVEPLISFGVQELTHRYFGKGPTVKQYTRAVKGFHKLWPQVKVFAPWNEENHVFQITAKHPKLAVQYYKVVKKVCPRCRVLGADVLDGPNLSSWLRRYQGYARQLKISPRIWGLHNYQDANHHRTFRQTWTYRLTKLVKGEIWATETGGQVGFTSTKGRVAYKFNPKRALRAQQYLFKLVGDRRVRSRYRRVYIHNFFGTWSKHKRTNRWDSGLVGLDGKPRPAYFDLKKRIAHG